MKNYTKLVLILAFALCYSCNGKQKEINTWNNRIAEFEPQSIKNNNSDPLRKSEPDKIVGKYYVDNFYHYLKSGFELKIKKPKNAFGLYTFEFKNSGKVIFKDLTDFYGCGNGILSIDKGKWKAKGNGVYELTFDGEYAFESIFHTVSEYSSVNLKNGNIKMNLNKIIANNKKPAWG